jgi:hypothetical protein
MSQNYPYFFYFFEFNINSSPRNQEFKSDHPKLSHPIQNKDNQSNKSNLPIPKSTHQKPFSISQHPKKAEQKKFKLSHREKKIQKYLKLKLNYKQKNTLKAERYPFKKKKQK